MRCRLDNLRAFVINTDQWMIAAQDADKWSRTVKQWAEFFMVNWMTAKRARTALRYEVACLNATGATRERAASSKYVRDTLATPDSHHDVNLYIFGTALRRISYDACFCFSCSVAPWLFSFIRWYWPLLFFRVLVKFFLLFPSISIDVAATTAASSFFRMGFCFVTTSWIFLRKLT